MELFGSTMQRAIKIELGEVVVIFGLGPVGLFLLQEVKVAGALEVIGVDLHQNRLKKAEELGVDMVIDASKHNVVEVIKEKYGQVDVCIDATGTDIVNTFLQILRYRGRFLVDGIPDKGVSFDSMLAYYREIEFGCIRNVLREEAADLVRRGQELVSAGRIKIKPIITHHLPLEKVVEGIKMCYEKPNEVLKVIIDIA